MALAIPVVLGVAGFPTRTHATDISDVPLITSPNVQAKPNLMFVLDNSGSMASAYMPDEVTDLNGGSYSSSYGYYSAQCNGVAYDPDLTYAAPLNADGTSYANATFSAAKQDGYVSNSSTTNLGATTTSTSTTSVTTSSVTVATGTVSFPISGSFNASTFTAGNAVVVSSSSLSMTGTITSWTGSGSSWTLVVSVSSKSGSGSSKSWTVKQTIITGNYYYYKYSGGTQKAMAWTYDSSGNVDTTTTFYKECSSADGSTPGSTVFGSKIYIVNQATDKQQNYANWYSYYRTRRLLMRTAVGRAFKVLDSSYRVGFSTISSSSVATSDYFQPILDFDSTQKGSVYTKLYAAEGTGTTPLRGALSKIGRYYAGNFISSTQADPVQYACQRNFVLLSTDGYWNTGAESSSYGPKDLSGSNVGNQDGTEVAPMYDGTNNYTVYTRTLYTVSSSKYSNSSCSRTSTTGSYYAVTSQPQTSTNNINWTNGSTTSSCLTATAVVYNGQTASSLSGTSFYSATTSAAAQSGGSSNTLADVAEYYYKTDLRTSTNCTSTSSGTSQNVCSNVVPTSGRDTATYQHMTTFTIGLGVNGTLAYDRDYLTKTTGDYADLVSGTKSWPIPTETSNGGDARNIDDLWHAAVNGRGQYYSALNATQLAEAISGVVSAIQEVTGSSAAATTSTLELVSGDNNQVYSASYTTGSWVGDLKAYSLNGTTGAISTTAAWSAQSKLTAMAYSARKIYYRGASSGALTAFNWTNLNADGYGGNFSLCATGSSVTQCGTLSTADKALANSGEQLVKYLSGDRSNESVNATLGSTAALYRARTGVLGDIINGAPKYVSKPQFGYSDTGYSDFVTAKTSRKPMIYVAANDGMLHAISADSTDGGTELWAYVPTAVMPNLYLLADSSYSTRHRYFVDGAPVVGDIYVNGAWKTILVGGLGKGGRSYYALDITNPQSPSLLWEFTDTNLGLAYGNPVITKRGDGTWVVVFASGYNNTDGVGRLFVLNANTGAKARTDISTGVGTAGSPSGLAKINGWIEQESDNTSLRFYGGDELGNLWRFDIDGVTQPYNSALRLAQFLVNGTTPQPVTTKPRLTKVDGKAVIVVGTGRYLSSTDISDTTQQTVYAVKDALGSTGLGDVRASTSMVQQVLTVSGTDATITSKTVNWATQNGWWVDLPHSGERVFTDIALQGSVLAISTAIPTGDACSSGGSSWNYVLSTGSGAALENTAGSQVSANSVVVGQSFVRLSDGTLKLLRQLSDGTTSLVKTPSSTSSNITPQRTSWRELTE